jgi:hypothetical protein
MSSWRSLPVAAISTVGDPQSVADDREVASTLSGHKRCCSECATLKIEVDALKREIGETKLGSS